MIWVVLKKALTKGGKKLTKSSVPGKDISKEEPVLVDLINSILWRRHLVEVTVKLEDQEG